MEKQTHNHCESQRQRCACKKNTVSSFTNEFLAGVTEAGQATVDTSKYENQDQHNHLQNATLSEGY